MNKLTTLNKLARKATLALAVAACLHGQAGAQAFPDKALTLVVPFGAGSRTDIVTRALGAELSPVIKQPVIVENRSGANQIVGDSYVAKAAPNGYTLLTVTLPSVTSPAVQAQLPYKSLTEFTPIASLVKGSGMIVVGANLPANNLKEFVALLKANPNKYAYGSGGNGSPLHLVIEMFNSEAGTTAIQVPYKSVNAVMTDIIAGHIHFGYVTLAAVQFVNAGKLKVIGITAPQRNPIYPTLPTIQEGGLKGFEYAASYVIVGPKGVPADIVGKLNAAINTAIGSDGFTSKMRPEDGVEVFKAATPEQTGAWIAKEEARWTSLVKSRNIQID